MSDAQKHHKAFLKARAIVVQAIKDKGAKVSSFNAADISRAAMEYLEAHPELLED